MFQFGKTLTLNATEWKNAPICSALDIEEMLKARDAKFGGRAEAKQLYYKINTDKRINFVDIPVFVLG